MPAPSVGVMTQDWTAIAHALDAHGYAVTQPLLSPDACRAIAAAYDQDGLYRSRV